MSEPHWASYIGMTTGIIGSITGIAGAIMGYISYRRSNSLKSLDLRLELKKAVSDVQADLSQINKLIEQAERSKISVAAAMGMSGSSSLQKWNQDVETDKKTLIQLVKSAPSINKNYDDFMPYELESELVEVHRLQVQVDELKNKYEAAIRADDETRKQIREDARTRFTQKQ